MLSALASSALYIMGCAAAWRLSRRGIGLAGTPLNFRLLGAAAVIGIASMVMIISLGARQEILGLAVVIAGSVVIFKVVRHSQRSLKG